MYCSGAGLVTSRVFKALIARAGDSHQHIRWECSRLNPKRSLYVELYGSASECKKYDTLRRMPLILAYISAKTNQASCVTYLHFQSESVQ